MIGRVVIIVWLTVVWVALSGDVTAANAVAGAFLGTLLVYVFPLERPFAPVIRPVAVARLAVVFTWRLIVSSAVVAWEIVTPRNRINEGIVAVPVFGASDVVVTVLANAVSLTPGTLTLEVDREANRLYIHVLHLHDVETVRRSVRELEVLIIRAFGDAACLDAVNRSVPVPPTIGETR